MPKGNDNDCESVQFYAPSDTFGGTKPVPSCLPGTERVPDELREPTGDLYPVVEYKTPPAITVINRAVTAICAEGSNGDVVNIAAGAYTSQVHFSEVLTISEVVLNYIAVENLVPQISQLVVDTEYSAKELARLTKMKLSDATQLMEAIRQAQDVLTATAQAVADSLLVCYWYNNAQAAECADPEMAHQSDHPDAVFSAHVPANVIKSTISQADADAKALQLAQSLINCFYVSDPFTVNCETRPDRPLEIMEAVPTDIVPVYPGLPRRVGTASVPAGEFISLVSKEDANQRALDYAYSLLVCFYINDPLYIACEDPNARNEGENPLLTNPKEIDLKNRTAGQYISLPLGYITSDLSKEDANQQAHDLVDSLLECCFINAALHVECDYYEVRDENGNPKLDEQGNPIRIPASQTQSPTYAIDIPAGTYTSCVSQEQADQLAQLAVEGQLECYYCNEIVLPTCVPEWVTNAVVDGIYLTIDIKDKDTGEILFPAGSVYKVKLPLDASTLYNPYTGRLEDMSTWSPDATVGADSGLVCSPEYPQSQQIAENAASAPLDFNPEDKRDDCSFSNDMIIIACVARNPYDPDNEELIQKGTTPTGEAYTFYSMFPVGTCLDEDLTTPNPGEVIEIPAGTITVTAADTPGTTSSGSPSYSKSNNDKLAKDYANQLALNMAESMLFCVFVNPYTEGFCVGTTSTVACSTYWRVGKNKPTYNLTAASSQAGNPVILPKATFMSTVSMQEVREQVLEFMQGAILCEYCNDPQQTTCGELGFSSLGPLNSAVIPACTIIADSVTEANSIAKALASSAQACGCREYNDETRYSCLGDSSKRESPTAGTDPKEVSQAEWVMYNEGVIPADTICAGTKAQANAIAQALAESMAACGWEGGGGGGGGGEGPKGDDGAPGSPCAGGCYGIYS